jgi:predicted nucleic acid-binding protein
LERNEIPRYVPDASIVVKWFIDEQDSKNARAIKDQFAKGAIDLEAPSLLEYETASALRFHPVVKFDSVQILEIMKSLQGLQITREPTPSDWATAQTLSLENPISIYDSIYIAFAVRGHSIMLTADQALIDKIKSRQVGEKLTLLKNLSLEDERSARATKATERTSVSINPRLEAKRNHIPHTPYPIDIGCHSLPSATISAAVFPDLNQIGILPIFRRVSSLSTIGVASSSSQSPSEHFNSLQALWLRGRTRAVVLHR